MPLLRKQKIELASVYLKQMQQALNVVVLSMKGIPVNEMNNVRMDLDDAQWQLAIVKKRVLAKSLGDEFEAVSVDVLEGSVAVLYTHNETDVYAPLKVINKRRKSRKKDKLEYGFEYVGGWYEKQWKDSLYVGTLADLPTKEELVAKFLFLLNHPVSSFARAMKAIADKQGGWVVGTSEALPVAEEAPVAEIAPVTEAASAEVTSEAMPSEGEASEENA